VLYRPRNSAHADRRTDFITISVEPFFYVLWKYAIFRFFTFQFPHMKYGKYWLHSQTNFFIANFYVLWLFKKSDCKLAIFFQEDPKWTSLNLKKLWIKKFIHAKFQLFNTFLTFVQENIRIFQETTSSNFKKFLIWICNFILKLAKHARFQLSSLYPDGLGFFFDHFWNKFQDFSEILLSEFKNIPNLSMQFYT
jgi:hypothetical protein